jgi:hypothetical protein
MNRARQNNRLNTHSEAVLALQPDVVCALLSQPIASITIPGSGLSGLTEDQIGVGLVVGFVFMFARPEVRSFISPTIGVGLFFVGMTFLHNAFRRKR